MSRLLLVLAGSLGTFVLKLVTDAFGSRLFEGVFADARRRTSKARRDRRRRLVDSGAAERWLVGYYQGRAMGDDLPVIRHGSSERTIGLYAPAAWLPNGPLRELVACAPVQGAGNVISSDERAAHLPGRIERRTRRLGQTIWNGDAVAVTKRPEGYVDGPTCRNVGYFDLVDDIIGLEDEALRCARWRVRRPRRRDGRPPRTPSDPPGLGGTGVIVIDDGAGALEVLVHRRSDSVTTQTGMWCATPTYMFEDPRAAGRTSSAYDVRVWNVLRELLEEVFGWDDLSHIKGRTDPDWFFHQIEEGRFVAGLVDTGALRLYHLGWSQSLTHGLIDGMTLLHLRGTPEERAEFRRSVKGTSTELHADAGSIRWMPLWSDELTEMLLRPTFHPVSTLAIRLAREHFALAGDTGS